MRPPVGGVSRLIIEAQATISGRGASIFSSPDPRERVLVIRSQIHQETYATNVRTRLRPRHTRPRCRRAAEQRDERAPF